jgi:hypothetical protein
VPTLDAAPAMGSRPRRAAGAVALGAAATLVLAGIGAAARFRAEDEEHDAPAARAPFAEPTTSPRASAPVAPAAPIVARVPEDPITDAASVPEQTEETPSESDHAAHATIAPHEGTTRRRVRTTRRAAGGAAHGTRRRHAEVELVEDPGF